MQAEHFHGGTPFRLPTNPDSPSRLPPGVPDRPGLPTGFTGRDLTERLHLAPPPLPRALGRKPLLGEPTSTRACAQPARPGHGCRGPANENRAVEVPGAAAPDVMYVPDPSPNRAGGALRHRPNRVDFSGQGCGAAPICAFG